MSQRVAAMNALLSEVDTLGVDELRVLTRIAWRLNMGAKQYGVLNVAADQRDFRGKELREELEDALVYSAIAWLKEQEK